LLAGGDRLKKRGPQDPENRKRNGQNLPIQGSFDDGTGEGPTSEKESLGQINLCKGNPKKEALKKRRLKRENIASLKGQKK